MRNTEASENAFVLGLWPPAPSSAPYAYALCCRKRPVRSFVVTVNFTLQPCWSELDGIANRVCSDCRSSWKTSMFPSVTTFPSPSSRRIMSWMPSSVRVSAFVPPVVPCSKEKLVGSSDPCFSFSGEVREPFPGVIQALEKTSLPVTSVDAPSSWNIEEGPPKSGVGSSFHPAVLVSLTAPKPLVKHFKGRHFVGGR